MKYTAIDLHKLFIGIGSNVFYRSIREDISGAKAAMRDAIPCPT